jgi:hypothetical protein
VAKENREVKPIGRQRLRARNQLQKARGSLVKVFSIELSQLNLQ